MMAADDPVFRELGDLMEFDRQWKIISSMGLDIVGPVYKSWEPSDRIGKKVLNSAKLKNVSTLDILLQAISIIKQYMMVTVRQVYYVLVSRQIIYNNLNEYKRIVRVLRNGRLAGLIGFDSIIDDTREAEKTPSWNSVEDILLAAVKQYRSYWWRNQQCHVEVWLEKRALRRIFYPITNSYDVYLCAGGGYQSWSEVWEARARFLARRGLNGKILYFGDLDPSGKDMPRDIHERFRILGLDVDVIEVALKKEDIMKYSLPRNPTKKKDSRQSWYVEKFGFDYAVELDALPPEILRERIKEAIEGHCDLQLLWENRIEDNLEREMWRKKILKSK